MITDSPDYIDRLIQRIATAESAIEDVTSNCASVANGLTDRSSKIERHVVKLQRQVTSVSNDTSSLQKFNITNTTSITDLRNRMNNLEKLPALSDMKTLRAEMTAMKQEIARLNSITQLPPGSSLMSYIDLKLEGMKVLSLFHFELKWPRYRNFLVFIIICFNINDEKQQNRHISVVLTRNEKKGTLFSSTFRVNYDTIKKF